MKIELIRKVMLVVTAILTGIAICMSVWFFLRAHKDRHRLAQERPTPSNKVLATDKGTVPQQRENNDEEPLTFAESAARGIKSDFMSIYTEEQLATPSMQKMLEIMDSPEFVKYLEKDNRTHRDWNDFLQSKGFPVNRTIFSKMFRDEFPTGEPADYEPEMRLKIAEMFLITEPVNPIDPQAAALQRARVVAELMTKEHTGRAWFIGQFGEDWDGAIQIEREGIESNPAFIWLTDVQRNAASIVANARALRVDTPEAQEATPSWDLSSIVESTSTSYGESEIPTTLDTSERALMTDTEIKAAIEKSLTSESLDVLTNQHSDTPDEVQSNLETGLKAQFSLKRFERAMSTLNQYGPKEGIRRLKESDPEVANHIERYRKQEEFSR